MTPIAQYGIPNFKGLPPTRADLGYFLLFCPDRNYEYDPGFIIGHYCEEDECWLSLESGLKLNPTHFQPLPNPREFYQGVLK